MGRTGGFSMKFHCHAIIIGLFSILALLLLDIYFNRKSYRENFIGENSIGGSAMKTSILEGKTAFVTESCQSQRNGLCHCQSFG